MRETLSGVRVIRAFVRTRHEEARFETASRDLFDVQLKASRIFAITQPVIFAIFNLSTVAVLWFGAMRVGVRRPADRQPDRLPAVPAPDPLRHADRRLHVHPHPARGGVVRPDPRGPRHRALDPRSGGPGPARAGRPRPRRRRVPRRRVPLSRRRAARPPRHLVPRRARPDDRDRRQHRQRQVDPDQPDPALLRRDAAAPSSSTGSTSGR